MKPFLKPVIASLLLTPMLSLSVPVVAQPNELQIPDIGSTAGAMMSERQERALGQAWLRMFRAQAPTVEDPLLVNYTTNLLEDLSTTSDYGRRPLDLVIVDSTSINAFAVPGGVIGVNSGLFFSARTEGQFASVLTHELAHLSQKHFQRRVEQQQQSVIPMVAMLLGSLAIAATAGGDAGMAAIMATQAAAQQNALRYSREAESEADRIGISNLAAAGYSPFDMQDMFAIMQRQTSSFGTAVPEYLRTHPMSDRRASDAALRAQQYPPIFEVDRSYYHFMRARAFTISTPNPRSLIAKFERQITANSVDSDAARYGLALVYSKDNEYDKALALLNQITRTSELEVVIDLAYVEILRDQSRFEEAQSLIDPLMIRHADQFAVSYANAQNLYDLRRFQQAIIELESLSESNPEHSEVWFMLAETYGLAGDLVGVHKARAEWYTLNGAFSQAVRQLGFARDLMNQQGYHVIDISRTEERMRQIRELQVESERL